MKARPHHTASSLEPLPLNLSSSCSEWQIERVTFLSRDSITSFPSHRSFCMGSLGITINSDSSFFQNFPYESLCSGQRVSQAWREGDVLPESDANCLRRHCPAPLSGRTSLTQAWLPRCQWLGYPAPILPVCLYQYQASLSDRSPSEKHSAAHSFLTSDGSRFVV